MAENDNFFATETSPEVTVNGGATSEQPAEGDKSVEAPAAPADKVEKQEEMILGKFKSQDDLVKGYQELEKQFTERRQAESRTATAEPVETSMTNASPQLDPDVLPALDRWYMERRETEKAQEFEQRHPELKEDRLLRATVADVIREANASGKYVDQESALELAKKEIAESVKPKVEEERKEGFQEGQEVAKAKEQASAIGNSGKREPVDESKLSAADYAKLLNLPRQ